MKKFKSSVVIGRVSKVADENGIFDILIEFPTKFKTVPDLPSGTSLVSTGPYPTRQEPSEWEAISLSEFIDARCR